MNQIIIYTILLLLGACSRSTTLNLNPRTFSAIPKNVIWIQVPGFELEHSALVRFSSSDSRKLLPLENVDCVGSAWSYNFYKLRTNAVESSLSQMTGSPEIKNNCASGERYPAWQYYRALGFTTYAVEFGVDKNSSLLSHAQCGNNTFLEGLTLLSMRTQEKKNEADKFFHYQSNKNLTTGAIHWDQTCQKDNKCFATLSNNIRSMWETIGNQSNSLFFIIRNFEYLNQLKLGKIQSAREILSEVDKIVSFFQELPNAEQTLILVTGGETQSLRLPKQGEEWRNFEKSGRNVLLERSRLLSPVLAKGPSAENFCGVYEESKILYRQFWRSDIQEFSLDSIIGLVN